MEETTWGNKDTPLEVGNDEETQDIFKLKCKRELPHVQLPQ